MKQDSGYRVDSITPHFGAVVRGVDLTAGGSPDAARELLDRHLVLVIPGQSLSPAQLRDFTSALGPLFLHHADEGVLPCEEAPEVLKMYKAADGTRLFGGSDWHADVTFRRPEGYVSVLHALTLPPVGGDTLFANNIAAFETLGDKMQDLLRGMTAVHSYDGPGQPDHPTETAVHPVVRTHPVSGREGLYINRMFAVRFEGMSAEESRPLIEQLDRHMSRPEFTCRVRWQPGQVVMWDNRFTLHYPINDFTGHERLLIRCTALVS